MRTVQRKMTDMKTFIGYFSKYTNLKVVNQSKQDTITPVSFTVCVEAETVEEAIEILTDYRMENTEQRYEPEFEELVTAWDTYTLQAVTESLY